MTISDFFLKQTSKEIKSKFKEVDLNKYIDIPESVELFCKKLNLEQDDQFMNLLVIKRYSTAEIYPTIKLPNPEFPDQPLIFSSRFDARSAKNGCSIAICDALSYHEDIRIFKQHTDFFDDRHIEETSELTYDIELNYLLDVREEYHNMYGETKYTISKKTTLWEVYLSLCEFIKGIGPVIKNIMKNIDNGTFEKIWNSIEPEHKWKYGNEPFKKMFFNRDITIYYRVIKAGIPYNFNDFVKLMAFESVHQLVDMENYLSLSSFDSNDEDVIKVFNEIINCYLKTD